MRFYTYREKQVLELACGTGQITFRMADKAAVWSATDYSENMGGFRSYPDEVQKKIYEDAVLGKLAPKKHIDSFLRGIPTFAVAALLVAVIVG